MKALIISTVLFYLYQPTANAQLTIDGKNISEDEQIEYIQFSFFYETKKMLPVYNIDYGLIINEESELKPQKIQINGEELNAQMTPAYVLNRLYNAGWEYVGDSMFMAAPMMENTQLYTLRRKKLK